MMQTERLRQALEAKGREEASLMLIDTLISDVTRALSERGEQGVREVLNEYSTNKTKLLDAVRAEKLPPGTLSPAEQAHPSEPQKDKPPQGGSPHTPEGQAAHAGKTPQNREAR